MRFVKGVERTCHSVAHRSHVSSSPQCLSWPLGHVLRHAICRYLTFWPLQRSPSTRVLTDQSPVPSSSTSQNVFFVHLATIWSVRLFVFALFRCRFLIVLLAIDIVIEPWTNCLALLAGVSNFAILRPFLTIANVIDALVRFFVSTPPFLAWKYSVPNLAVQIVKAIGLMVGE